MPSWFFSIESNTRLVSLRSRLIVLWRYSVNVDFQLYTNLTPWFLPFPSHPIPYQTPYPPIKKVKNTIYSQED